MMQKQEADMDAAQLRVMQAPIKERYKADPATLCGLVDHRQGAADGHQA
jgi:hypothetical protein